MFALALRNIFRQKGRVTITLAAITFGVVALILSGGFVEDVLVQLREVTIHSQLGHIQIQSAGFREHGRTEPYKYLLEAPTSIVEGLHKVSGVKEVLQRLQFSGLLSNGRADVPIIGEGVEPDKEARLGTFMKISDGRHLQDSDTLGILVGQGVAGALKLRPGDHVTAMVNTPDGALNSLEFAVVGVFQTFSKDYDDRAIRIPLAAAQEMMATNSIHTLVLHLDSTERAAPLAAQIRRSLPAKRFETFTWFELADFYRSAVALYERQFGILQFIILCMVVLGVTNSVNMAIFERTGEFGTQMATGDRRSRVFLLIMTETGILGVVGSLFGLALGVVLALAISHAGIPMPPPPNSNTGYTAYIRIVPATLITAVGVGIVASLIAAILPAAKTSRLPIIDALRRNI